MSVKRTSRVRLLNSRSTSNVSDKEGSIRNWLNNVREYSGEWVKDAGSPEKSRAQSNASNEKSRTQSHASQEKSRAQSHASHERSRAQSPEQSHVADPELLRQKLEGLAAERRWGGEVDAEPVDNRVSNTVTLRLQMSTPTAAATVAAEAFNKPKYEAFRVCRQGTPRRERTFIRADLPKTVRVYRQTCRKLRILPLRRVIGQFGRSRIILTDLCLSSADVRATCKALLHEVSANYLDFSGNTIGAVECKKVLQMLSSNHLLTELRLADNFLSGAGIVSVLKYFSAFKVITVLDISGNKLTDRDGTTVADIIKVSPQLRVLHAHHNEFRELGGKAIGSVIAQKCGLEELDLSWNHIRQLGAIGIARGLEKNTSLLYVNLGWNGFGYEGCVALSDALRHNIRLEKLDISCNRVHPPALMELMKGLFCNKVLKVLVLDRNPLTPSFTSILLEGLLRNVHTMSLQELSLKGVVVDRDFQGLLESIQQEKIFQIEYETSLPVSCKKRDDMMKEVEMRNNYNIEPLRMLYLLKERNRAQDFFHKINKDHDDGLEPDELSLLFKESGIPVSKYVIDRIMQFMDTDKDGKIDLGEFLAGDKKMKKLTRDHARTVGDTQNTHYSRTFRKAHIQQLTSRLQVDEIQPQYLSPIASASQSQASSRRSSLNYP